MTLAVRAFAFVSALLVVAASRPAGACSWAGLPPFELDPKEEAVDVTPPSAIGSTTYSVERGRGPQKDGCGTSGSSCDDVGVITLHLGEATDDRTPDASLGYRVEVVSGKAPSDPSWPTAAVRAHEGRVLYFHWNDGGDDDQEPIDLTFRIRAVDLAGNEGPPLDVRIRDAGSSEDGCRTARGGVDLSWAVALALLGALRRSRRPWFAGA